MNSGAYGVCEREDEGHKRGYFEYKRIKKTIEEESFGGIKFLENGVLRVFNK